MTKSIFAFLFIFICLVPFAADAKTVPPPNYSGAILIQTNSYNRLWYVYPKDHTRYYLKDSKSAYSLIHTLGHSISTKELHVPGSKINTQYRGQFLFNSDDVWYVNPKTGAREYLGSNSEEIIAAIQKSGSAIQDTQLARIPMNTRQIVPDTAFLSVASAKIKNGVYVGGSSSNTILPIASLTKLMTALVILDHDPDWSRSIIMTQKYLAYPKRFVGDDVTSEVDFKEGDHVTINDLWTTLLISSSNQAAAALADNMGISEPEFIGLMNKKARSLGLKKTVFYDVAGLDAHTVSTAREMAVIAEKAFAISKIAKTSSTPLTSVTLVSGSGVKHKIGIKNRNYSALAFNPDGVKTGFLVEAQRNLALKKGNEIIIVLHARSMGERNKVIKKLL